MFDQHGHLTVAAAQDGMPSVGVIDFDSAWAGCPESDLARLELWRGIVGDGFREAYGSHVPVSPRYPERRPILQLLWCLEYARPTPQHHADTARICAELGIEPVTFKVAMAPSSHSGG
ncbi:MAG TPA: fructosamine kinase family protein [Chloroflexota bacterium]|nr:fructosamine kinase family protein [Chloroflexota bacterium]